MQCLLLFVPLKVFDLAGLMPMPGELLGIPQLWAMLLTAAVGVGVGLTYIGISKNVGDGDQPDSAYSNTAAPVLVWSRSGGVVTKSVSMTMPAAGPLIHQAVFDADTLEPEGAIQGERQGWDFIST